MKKGPDDYFAEAKAKRIRNLNKASRMFCLSDFESQSS